MDSQVGQGLERSCGIIVDGGVSSVGGGHSGLETRVEEWRKAGNGGRNLSSGCAREGVKD